MMSDYCVILRGRLPGDRDDASLWAPIASSLRLDEATFAIRVLAALPLIVRRQLDQDAASRLVARLAQTGVDACAVPDDTQLAYLERDGSTRGPVPLSALAQFIQPGERYRLRDSQDWKTWSSAEVVSTDKMEVASDVEPLSPEAIGAGEAEPERVPPPPGDRSPAVAVGPAGADAQVQTSNAADPNAAASPPTLPAATKATPTLSTATLSTPGDAMPADGPDESGGSTHCDPAEPQAPSRTSGLAIAAGCLGLLALVPPIAPLTLIVGILAWQDLRRRPRMRGRGLTVFGLIMGTLMTLLLVIGVAVGVSPSKQLTLLLSASTPVDHTPAAAIAPVVAAGSSTDEPVTPSSAVATPAASVAASSTAASPAASTAASSSMSAPATSGSAAIRDMPAETRSVIPAAADATTAPASRSTSHP